MSLNDGITTGAQFRREPRHAFRSRCTRRLDHSAEALTLRHRSPPLARDALWPDTIYYCLFKSRYFGLMSVF
jgi:hypothetical protein